MEMKINMATLTDELTVIEETLLKIAENDQKAIKKLHDLLRQYKNKTLPDGLNAAISENINLILDDLNFASSNAPIQELLIGLAELGIDSLQLRDALAVIFRNRQASYPDPAGLVRSLGLFDQATSINDVIKRWSTFSLMKEKCIVWHNSYGIGYIAEIDALSDLVYIQFQSKQHISLTQAMNTLSIINDHSVIKPIIENNENSIKIQKDSKEFEDYLATSFVPNLTNPGLVMDTLLSSKRINSLSYNEWKQGNAKKKKQISTSNKPREWHQARGLEELKLCLQGLTSIKAGDDEANHLLKLFKIEATKPNSLIAFRDTLSTLWSICGKQKWLIDMINELPENTLIWSDIDTFILLTCKLPSKLVANWLIVSYYGNSKDWLLDQITVLPLKFWIAAEKVLANLDISNQDLLDIAHSKLKNKTATSDAVVWLWKQKNPEINKTLANHIIVFKILNQKVKGEYAEAQKDLFKLLMNDQTFQTVLMDNGSEKGINTFVKTVKNVSLLNKGEQQSLLVKILRIFPDAQSLVEDKKKVLPKKAIEKVTSIRSIVTREKELAKIINEKIPQNSAAIAHARSYGDLRENAEYKAAKEEQRLLMVRRGELEKGLKEMMGTDFSEVVKFESVIPGCTVTLGHEGEKLESYHILGLWDSLPEKNILSYDTPMVRILLGTKKGEQITTPQDKIAIISDITKLPAEILDWAKSD